MAIEAYDDVPLAKTKLQSGDRLLFYTDGITERFNLQGECYEVERLGEIFAKVCDKDADKTVTKIMEDVNRFAGGLPAQDDQALLICQVD